MRGVLVYIKETQLCAYLQSVNSSLNVYTHTEFSFFPLGENTSKLNSPLTRFVLRHLFIIFAYILHFSTIIRHHLLRIPAIIRTSARVPLFGVSLNVPEWMLNWRSGGSRKKEERIGTRVEKRNPLFKMHMK